MGHFMNKMVEQVRVTPKGPTVLTNGSATGSDLDQLKKELEEYKHILAPLNNVMDWEQPHHPLIITSVVTALFSLVWYLQPSVITTFSLVGVVLCSVDFVVPTLSGYLFKGAEWSIDQECGFTDLCCRLQSVRAWVHHWTDVLATIKNQKPKMFLLGMMGTLTVVAWVGSLMHNLLLTYIFVISLVTYPGMAKHGLFSKVYAGCKEVVTRLVMGPPKHGEKIRK